MDNYTAAFSSNVILRAWTSNVLGFKLYKQTNKKKLTRFNSLLCGWSAYISQTTFQRKITDLITQATSRQELMLAFPRLLANIGLGLFGGVDSGPLLPKCVLCVVSCCVHACCDGWNAEDRVSPQGLIKCIFLEEEKKNGKSFSLENDSSCQ